MGTLNSMKTTVGRRTGMSASSNLLPVCRDAFDDFLQEACLQHDFQEMHHQCEIVITQSAYNATMPSATDVTFIASFNTAIHNITGTFLMYGSSNTYPFYLKTPQWLNGHFQDRYRTGAQQHQPHYGCQIADKFHWQSPADRAYTLYLDTTHLPKSDLFADGDTSQTNPVPKLDQALINYGCYEVFQGMGNDRQADKYYQKAYQLLGIALAADDKVPGRVMRVHGHGVGRHPNPSAMAYDQDGLNDLYVEGGDFH